MSVFTELRQSALVDKRAQPHSQYSILLADDNLEFRRGLRSLVEFYDHHSAAHCVVVGEAVSKAQVLQQTLKQHPQLVLLSADLDDSWVSTLSLIKELQQLDNAPSILLISEQQDADCLFEGMQSGASGYITKDRIATELFVAINTIEAQQVYLSQSMVNTFFYLFQSTAKQSLKKCKLLKLSKREQELLALLAQGESNETIANKLFISVATVKSHFTSIFEKLGVKSRTQAIIRALRLGLV